MATIDSHDNWTQQQRIKKDTDMQGFHAIVSQKIQMHCGKLCRNKALSNVPIKKSTDKDCMKKRKQTLARNCCRSRAIPRMHNFQSWSHVPQNCFIFGTPHCSFRSCHFHKMSLVQFGKQQQQQQQQQQQPKLGSIWNGPIQTTKNDPPPKKCPRRKRGKKRRNGVGGWIFTLDGRPNVGPSKRGLAFDPNIGISNRKHL